MNWLKRWYLQKFRKEDILKVYMFDNTGRIKDFIVLPKEDEDNTIEIEGGTYTYLLKDVVYMKGIPCLFYKRDNPKPINIKNEGNIPEITAQEFNTALNNTVVKDLMKAGKDDTKENIMFMACVGTFAIAGIALYLLYQQSEVLTELMTRINELEVLIEELMVMTQ